MSTPFRRAVVAGLATAAVVGGALTGAGSASAASAAPASHPAGAVGAAVMVARAQDLAGYHPYDLATSPSGTAYFAWIGETVNTGADREIHLCTLAPNATTCSGGIQTVLTPHPESARELYVRATRTGVALFWFHDTDASGSGPEGGAVAEATAVNGLHVSAEHDLYAAPSNGDLMDAELTPSGQLWTVTYTGLVNGRFQVHSGAATYATIPQPYSNGIGLAQLAFSGSNAVLAVSKYGAIGSPVAYSVRSSTGVWGRFGTVSGTWTGGGLTLVGTAHGMRLVTGVNDASYRPVLSAWTGSAFTKRALTADANNCGPSSHDGSTDASGRLVDASWECNDITVADYADGAHAGIVRIGVAGTPTATPQIGESTSGLASVAWSVQDSAGGSVLRITRLRLANASRTVSAAAAGGSVSVTGPVSCLPAVDARVAVADRAARGWKLLSRTLTLGTTKVGSVVDGAALASHRTYTLHGYALFARRTARSLARVTLSFTTC